MGYRLAWVALALLLVMTLFVVGYCVSQPTTVERVREPGLNRSGDLGEPAP